MDKIKAQVSAIVVFNATELDALDKEYLIISQRIDEGLSKMKDSQLYCEKEIKEVQSYANTILGARYRATKENIISNKRDEFQF